MKLRWLIAAALLLLFTAACGGGAAHQEGAASDADSEHLDAMSKEHEGDTTEPSPAVAPAPRGPVESSVVRYGDLDGTEVSGYLAVPEGGATGKPGILVIHEWWGLNDNIRAMADRLAGEGYVALAVDLYEGGVAETPQEARALMGKAGGADDRLELNIGQAYKFLVGQTGPTKVGVIGWCFGGGWSLRTAQLLEYRLHGAVIYYGRVSSDADALAPITAPVLGIFGAEDRGIPIDGVRAFEAEMQAQSKDVEIHVYDGADHAFANPSGQRYQAEAAEDAWAKTLAFFARTLQSD